MRVWLLAIVLAGCISDAGPQIVEIDSPPTILLAMANDTGAELVLEVRLAQGGKLFDARNVTIPAANSTTQVYQFAQDILSIGVAWANGTPPQDAPIHPQAHDQENGTVPLRGWPSVFASYDARTCGALDAMRVIVRATLVDGAVQLDSGVERCIKLR
jgi:hypothetical protein